MDVKPGSHLVRVCSGLPCRLTGATDHLRALRDRLAIPPGQTTADGRVTLEKAPCLSVCSLAPVVEVDGVCHGRVTAAAIDRLPVWYRTRPPWPVDVDASDFPNVQAVGASARERLASLRSRAEARARTRPEWRLLVQGGSCGEALGAAETLKALRILAAMRGLDAEVLDGGCHGLCAAGIVVEVQRTGWPPLTFTHLTTDTTPDFLSAIVSDTPSSTRFAGVAWNSEGWRGIPPASRHPFFARQRRVIMDRCGHLHPISLDDALLRDGYSALARVLDSCSGVREDGFGRGWRAVGGTRLRRAAHDVTEAVKASACFVVRGEDGIPGLFTDRHLMEGDPHRVLEGLAIAAHAEGTTHGVIRINGEARQSLQRMARALAKAQAAGLVGDRILGSAFSFHVEIRQEVPGSSPDEGRGSNIAALAALVPLIAEGDGAPARSGRRRTTLCSVSGALDRPGMVEVDGAVTLRELLSEVAGGIRDRGGSHQALVVGPPGVPLSPQSLDTPIESLAAFSGGGGGVIAILDDDGL
jgi:(2Fe-2S) ferredoxin